MKKLSSILFLCLIFLLFSSCAPDLTDDVERAYDAAKCTTIDGNMWSQKSSYEKDWNRAVSYCNHLTECGYSDWHLPTISELRTLIQNCSGTVTGGSCGVTDSCLSSGCWDADSCYSCSYDESVHYSKLGDSSWLWSSSVQSDDPNYAWSVNFSYGRVGDGSKIYSGYVRCVR